MLDSSSSLFTPPPRAANRMVPTTGANQLLLKLFLALAATYTVALCRRVACGFSSGDGKPLSIQLWPPVPLLEDQVKGTTPRYAQRNPSCNGRKSHPFRLGLLSFPQAIIMRQRRRGVRVPSAQNKHGGQASQSASTSTSSFSTMSLRNGPFETCARSVLACALSARCGDASEMRLDTAGGCPVAERR